MIREINIDEIEKCIQVITQSFITVAKEFGLTKENCERHPSFYTNEVLLNHFNMGYKMFGLFQDDKMVGYFSLSSEDNIFEIHNLSVLPEFRHKGYGKKILDFCKDFTVNNNGLKIKIDIIEDNEILKNWYIQNGFKTTSISKIEHLPFKRVGFMEWSKD